MMLRRFSTLRASSDGLAAIEAGLIAAIISLGIVAALITTKKKNQSVLSCVSQNLFIAGIEGAKAAPCGSAQALATAGASEAQAYLLGMFPGKQPNLALMNNRVGAINIASTILFSDVGAMAQASDGSWYRATTMYNSLDGTLFNFGLADPAYGNDGLPNSAGSYRQSATDPNVFISNANPNFILYKTDFGYYGFIMK